MNGKIKSCSELRKNLYESIIDESLFISRASEGAVSAEWVFDQPVFIRKKYLEIFKEELEERRKAIESRNSKH